MYYEYVCIYTRWTKFPTAIPSIHFIIEDKDSNNKWHSEWANQTHPFATISQNV